MNDIEPHVYMGRTLSQFHCAEDTNLEPGVPLFSARGARYPYKRPPQPSVGDRHSAALYGFSRALYRALSLYPRTLAGVPRITPLDGPLSISLS